MENRRIKFKSESCKSNNLTNGGDGTNGYHHTDEYKQFK